MTATRKARQISARTRRLALVYLRVSTTEQVEGGASLDAQRAMLTAEAERRGWDVEVIADEGVSAKTVTGRPGLTAALDRLDRGEADALMAQRVDRLSRSVSDFAQLMARAQSRGWSLVALDLGVDTTTPAGDLMANVLASVAQYERKIIGQRTHEGMAQRRDEGHHVGRKPETPRELVAEIVELRRSGQTFDAIAKALNERKEPTVRGGRCWWPSTVKRVLEGSLAREVAASNAREVAEFQAAIERDGFDAAVSARESKLRARRSVSASRS